MQSLALHVRAVAVDRPGAGWSDPGPEVLPGEIADRLHKALDAAGVPPPYLLVGHSLGGFHVRAFAARYPGETAALLLVDPSHERMHEAFGLPGLRQRALMAALTGAMSMLSVLRVRPLLSVLVAPRRLLSLLFDEEQTRRLVRRQMCTPTAVRAAKNERDSVPRACAQIAALIEDPGLPVRVLSAAALSSRDRRSGPRDAINALHRELARSRVDGQHQVCAGTTHMMPIEHPDVVVDAVLALAKARTA
jgi:pimeloyl-ACP methyl ester carboxylesterase